MLSYNARVVVVLFQILTYFLNHLISKCLFKLKRIDWAKFVKKSSDSLVNEYFRNGKMHSYDAKLSMHLLKIHT